MQAFFAPRKPTPAASAPASKRPRCSSPERHDSHSPADLLLGSAVLTAFSTVNLPSTQKFPAEGGGMSSLLTPNRPLELQCLANAKPEKRGRGNKKRTPEEHVRASVAASSIRFTACGTEVGKFPADAAKCLVPLLLQDRIAITAVVGPKPPAELELGISVPVRITITLGKAAFASQKIESSGATSAALEKAEWSRILCSSAMPCLLKLLNLHLKHKAMTIAPSAEELVNGPIVVDGADAMEVEEPESPSEMSSEVAAQLGSSEALARLTLPKVSIPQSVFKTSLHSYQAQAVFWMWSQENPGVSLAPQWLVDASSAGTSAIDLENQQQLDPTWEEYELYEPKRQPLYFNRVTGALSLNFPKADLGHCCGGILADDMGLGKTVMCLAALALDKAIGAPDEVQDNDVKPGGTLMVVPTSLLHQWVAEIDLHFPPAFKPSHHLYHGAGCKAEELQGFDVVLTTYGTLQNASPSSPLMQMQWRRIILDEAHIIKNRHGKRTQAVFRLRGRRRWAVTGTPMQNNVDELYAFVRFLGVQPWSAWSAWQHMVSEPLRSGDVTGALNEANRIMQPLLIRRTKQTIDLSTGQPLVRLPPKEVHILEVDLSPAERAVYDAIYRTMKGKFDNLVASDRALSSYVEMFYMLLVLRQTASHPFLPFARSKPQDLSLDAFAERCFGGAARDDSTASPTKVKAACDSQLIRNLLESAAGPETNVCVCCGDIAEAAPPVSCGHIVCRPCSIGEQFRAGCTACQKEEFGTGGEGVLPLELQSSKIRSLVKALAADMAAGRHVVVFSQWTKFLKLIGRALDAQEPGIAWQRFDGSLNISQRQDVLAWLKGGPTSKPGGRVLLVSLMAGCVGLNLTTATRLYMMDIWWNPAIEEQAINRIHRIGQTQTVHIYKFLVKDSIEHGIMAVQQAKARMCSELLDKKSTTSGQHGKLGLEDFKLLFSNGGGCGGELVADGGG